MFGTPPSRSTPCDGDDYISAQFIGSPPDFSEGFLGASHISTGEGDDEIVASNLSVVQINAGDDDDLVRFNPGSGEATSPPANDVRGGRGTDTLSMNLYQGTGYRISLDNRANDGLPDDLDNVHADIENLVAPNAGFVAVGSAAANIIKGRPGPDRIVGRGGKDKLKGGGGNDLIDARDGLGGDTIQCGPGRDKVLLDHGDRLQDRRACETVIYRR